MMGQPNLSPAADLLERLLHLYHSGGKDTEVAKEAADEIKRLREEGEKDYADMRAFQTKYMAVDRELRQLREHLKTRSLVDPVTRLHNICDALNEDAKVSPFTAAAWRAADEEAARMAEEIAQLRRDRAELVALRGLDFGPDEPCKKCAALETTCLWLIAKISRLEEGSPQ